MMKLRESHNFERANANGNFSGSNDSSSRRSRNRRTTAATTRNPRTTMGKRVRKSVTGKWSRPETPLLKWRLAERREKAEKEVVVVVDEENMCIPLSARKLGADLWRMQRTETTTGREEERLSSKPASPVVKIHSETKRRSRTHCRISNSTMEGATKWNPVCRSDEELETELKAELNQARRRVEELETERRSSKKKLEKFLRKLFEERASWRAQEHDKFRVYIDDIQATLSREKKTRQRLELINSNLVNELANSKMSAKKLAHDYEKERKARELIEEVCDELAKEIGGDKAEVEEVKKEAMKIKEEVDDERKMLQMAEVWREERVQMKLIDAKVSLEEKYTEMNKLVSQLKSFISSHQDQNSVKEANSLIQVANSVNIKDFSEMKYEPANPDDIFSMFDGQTYSPASPASKIHAVSPEVNITNFGDLEDDESGWETVSRVDDQGSSYSETVSELEEETPLPTKNSKKVSPISKLWKTVLQNSDYYKLISVDQEKVARKDETEQWSSPGMIGCIEWPRGVHKPNTKSNQKIQLRHILKQKI